MRSVEAPWSSVEVSTEAHGARWSSMELRCGLHGVPDSVGRRPWECYGVRIVFINLLYLGESHTANVESVILWCA